MHLTSLNPSIISPGSEGVQWPAGRKQTSSHDEDDTCLHSSGQARHRTCCHYWAHTCLLWFLINLTHDTVQRQVLFCLLVTSLAPVLFSLIPVHWWLNCVQCRFNIMCLTYVKPFHLLNSYRFLQYVAQFAVVVHFVHNAPAHMWAKYVIWKHTHPCFCRQKSGLM